MADRVKLLSGGNPQVPKGEGHSRVQARHPSPTGVASPPKSSPRAAARPRAASAASPKVTTKRALTAPAHPPGGDTQRDEVNQRGPSSSSTSCTTRSSPRWKAG